MHSAKQLLISPPKLCLVICIVFLFSKTEEKAKQLYGDYGLLSEAIHFYIAFISIKSLLTYLLGGGITALDAYLFKDKQDQFYLFMSSH